MTSEEFRNNPLFLRNQFSATGIFEMPLIKKQPIDVSDIQLIGYDKTKPNDKMNKSKYVHFFLDDYKFGALWNDPEPRLEKLRQYKGVLSPQFSTYTEMPISIHIYNTFRSRWVGAYLQSKGIQVIPTVYWGLPISYWFCFDGIEKGSVVALTTLGVKKEKDFFLQGYNEMLKRIKPEAIICYCEPFKEMQGNVITIDYAETNNLTQNSKIFSSGIVDKWYTGFAQSHLEQSVPLMEHKVQTYISMYTKKTCGYVFSKGFGSASGRGTLKPNKDGYLG